MKPIARVGEGLVRFWRGLIVTPIRHGRLRDTGWPSGLRPVVVVGIVAFCLGVVIIVAAGAIRAISPVSASVGESVLSLPRLMLPTIFWLVIVSLGLMQTAALHTRRRTAVVLTFMTSLIVLFIGSLDLGTDDAGGAAVTPGKAVSVIAVLALIAIVVLRRRSTFAWWEFPLVVAVIGVSSVLSLGRSAAQSAPYGIDFGPSSASLVMSTLGQLAVPAALAAGVAVAEFAIVAAMSAVAAVHRPSADGGQPLARRAIPVVLVVVFVLVAGWRIVEVVIGMAAEFGPEITLTHIPLSVGIVAAMIGLWVLIGRVRRSRVVVADDVLAQSDPVMLPIAAALSITLAPLVITLLIVQILSAWGGEGPVVDALRALADLVRGTAALVIVRSVVGVALIVLALVVARRGTRGLPELFAVVGLVTLVSVLPMVLTEAPLWSQSALASVIALGTLVLAGVLAVRRVLTARRLALLTVALLLSAAVVWRELLSDPVSVIIGAGGVALVLFGFVWGFVTDADVTHGESAAYPRASRVMLFLANAVFGITVLAFGALARDIGAGINLDGFAQFGDELLGTALILAVVGAVWSSALAPDSADSRPAAPSVAP
ncbi:MAG: hypothetical protein RL499_841 [Actinomycetota bacterium]